MRKLILIYVLFFSTSVLAEGFKYLCEENEKYSIRSNKDLNTKVVKHENLDKFLFEKKYFGDYEAFFINGSKFNSEISNIIECRDMHTDMTCISNNKVVYFKFSQNKFSLVKNYFFPDAFKTDSTLEYSFGYCYD